MDEQPRTVRLWACVDLGIDTVRCQLTRTSDGGLYDKVRLDLGDNAYIFVSLDELAGIRDNIAAFLESPEAQRLAEATARPKADVAKEGGNGSSA